MDPRIWPSKTGRPDRTYIQQLCKYTGYSPEDLPEAMNNREKWRERVRDIRASGTTWWWWWWWWFDPNWHYHSELWQWNDTSISSDLQDWIATIWCSLVSSQNTLPFLDRSPPSAEDTVGIFWAPPTEREIVNGVITLENKANFWCSW